MYNSAGRFSTPLKTFSSRCVFRPFIEQGASPPVLWSRGASPPSSWGCPFPRSRLPALLYWMELCAVISDIAPKQVYTQNFNCDIPLNSLLSATEYRYVYSVTSGLGNLIKCVTKWCYSPWLQVTKLLQDVTKLDQMLTKLDQMLKNLTRC